MDILDCEAETKIRAKYLRAMEEEQFDLMPSPTYVRGFLRTYADFLDLDGRLVLDEYESRFGAYSLSQEGGARSGRPSRSDSGGPRRSPEPPRRPGRPRKRRRTEVQLLWLAIGGVMAVALLIWLGVGQSDTQTPVAPAPTTSTGPRSVPAVVEPDTASTEAPVRAKKTQIVLAGTGVNGCWVQVRSRNAKGRIVFEQILTPGDSQTFRVAEGIWVNASNPAELVVTVGGKVTDLNSTSGGTWLITPTGAKSLG